MGVYERLGIRPVINATCHWTVYGGSIMWPEVSDAMADARRHAVDMRQLLDRASEVIAGIRTRRRPTSSPDARPHWRSARPRS